MKKVSALIVFTLLVAAGYYIGNAVAQNKVAPANSANDGVMVIEEEYGVMAPAAKNSDMSMPAKSQDKMPMMDKANSSMDSNNDNNEVTVDETVTEEGYIEE